MICATVIPASCVPSRRLAANLCGRGSLCQRIACASDRVEEREGKEPGEEAADMRLPGDRPGGAGHKAFGQAEKEIDGEPHQDEGERARIPENCEERLGRHAYALHGAGCSQADTGCEREAR